MHIGFDGRILAGPPRGMARYTRSLLQALIEVAPHYRYSLYSDRPLAVGDIPGLTIRTISANRRFWASRVLPRIVSDDGVQVMHFPYNTCWLRPACQTVVTLHDVNPLLDRRFGWRNRLAYVTYLACMSYVRAALITDSHASKQSIEQVWPPLRGHVNVVFLGVNPIFDCVPDPLKGAMGSDQSYILFVGGCDPNKNLLTVLRAIASPVLALFTQLQLIIVGRCSPSSYGTIVRTAIKELNLERRVQWLDRVSDQELSGLYQGALALVYPSFREGFGIPVLEAMSRGTPVIASNTTSIPEIAGDAALLVSPDNVEMLAHALLSVLADPHLAQRLRDKGRERARLFSWQETARQTLQVYEQVMGRS